MTDTNTTLPAVPTEKPAEPPVSAEELVRRANGFPGTKTIPTDEYIEQREEKRREKKGGIRYKIDKQTKQIAELREKLEAKEKNQTSPPAAPPAQAVPVTPSPAPPAVVEDKPDPRPKREEFTDEGEFTTKIAEWVVRQQNKIVAAAPPPAAAPAPEVPKEVTYDPTNPEHVRIKTEFDAFMSAGHEFMKVNPDFQDRLNAAEVKGLKLNNVAQQAIMKLKAPQILYYLADPANEAQARALMAMDAVSQVMHISLLHDRLQVKPSDFVSNAPPPGQHLTNGSTRATIPRDKMDPDDYIQLRKEEKRAKRLGVGRH